jgi:hypothetical protein
MKGKSVFLAVNASLCWLNNVSGVYLVQVSLILIVSKPLLPIGLLTGKIVRQRRRKMAIQRQPLLLQYKQQANPLLSVHNYTPLVIRRNGKNKPLTLLSQGKLHGINRNKYTVCTMKSSQPQPRPIL